MLEKLYWVVFEVSFAREIQERNELESTVARGASKGMWDHFRRCTIILYSKGA